MNAPAGEGKTNRRAMTAMIISNLCLIGALSGLALLRFSGVWGEERRCRSLPESLRLAAAALEARGLYDAALKEYEKYREKSHPCADEEAELLYKMAKIADENLGDCKQALAYYTMAAALRPAADWNRTAEKRIVYCLEKSGQAQQAQALLRQFTAGEKSGAPAAEPMAGSPVVAVVDGRSVSWAEVEAAAKARGKTADLSDPEKRKRLLHEYVFTLMLAESAKRGGLDQDPANQPALEQARREALAALYLAVHPEQSGGEAALKALWENLLNVHQARVFDGAIPEP